MLSSNYNDVLILFSFIVAMLASYTALDMAGRVATTQGRASKLWLAGGALAMGIGIWSMHFIGMLAFSLPVSMGYDPLITLFSMLSLSFLPLLPCGWCATSVCRPKACCLARC